MSEQETPQSVAARLYRYCKREYDCPHPSVDDVEEALAAAEERGRRAGIEAMQLGTCRVYRHGCADGRAIENRMADRWREYALPHPKRENCLEWVALAPRDSAPVCDCEAPLWGGAHLASCAAYPRGSSCGADEDGIHREARRDRK